MLREDRKCLVARGLTHGWTSQSRHPTMVDRVRADARDSTFQWQVIAGIPGNQS